MYGKRNTKKNQIKRLKKLDPQKAKNWENQEQSSSLPPSTRNNVQSLCAGPLLFKDPLAKPRYALHLGNSTGALPTLHYRAAAPLVVTAAGNHFHSLVCNTAAVTAFSRCNQ